MNCKYNTENECLRHISVCFYETLIPETASCRQCVSDAIDMNETRLGYDRAAQWELQLSRTVYQKEIYYISIISAFVSNTLIVMMVREIRESPVNYLQLKTETSVCKITLDLGTSVSSNIQKHCQLR